MPDFRAPEYASYVALCRELRLPCWNREGLTVTTLADGEWFYSEDNAYVSDVGHIQQERVSQGRDDWTEAGEHDVWIPTGDDWDEKLEAAGVRYVGILRRSDTEVEFGGPYRYTAEANPTPSGPVEARAPTRIEAKARLWCTVTGRTPGA